MLFPRGADLHSRGSDRGRLRNKDPELNQVEVTFPDGSVRSFPRGTSFSDLARAWNPSVAEQAIAAVENGNQSDIYLPIEQSARVSFIIPESREALEIYRHTTSHLLAHAVKELFPEVKIGIGPATDEGFFYDFERQEPFSPEDLDRIEAKMRELKAQDLPIRRVELPKGQALEYFRGLGDNLKVELVDEKGGDVVSCYR